MDRLYERAQTCVDDLGCEFSPQTEDLKRGADSGRLSRAQVDQHRSQRFSNLFCWREQLRSGN